LACNL
jgi:hypothetical protein